MFACQIIDTVLYVILASFYTYISTVMWKKFRVTPKGASETHDRGKQTSSVFRLCIAAAVGGFGMNDEQLADLVLDAGISIDGSWNKRGWSARDGVVAVISIDTGKVLDVVFLSNSCTTCEQMKRKRKDGAISRIDYLSWVVSHDESCFHNHEGSSQVCLFVPIQFLLLEF
jgi:hypothetical protein